jgi:hypothetical protein
VSPTRSPCPRGDDDFRLFVDGSLSRLDRGGAIIDVLAKSFGSAKLSQLVEAPFIVSALPD